MDRAPLIAAIATTALLASCSRQPPAGPPTKLVVIGNSLACKIAEARPGCPGERGLAATGPETDYAHLVGAQLRLPVTVSNFAALEKTPETAAARMKVLAADVDRKTLVVVQLGDNAPAATPEFKEAYGQLLDAVDARAALICVTTWWEHAGKDKIIRDACTAHDGEVVAIGDIFPVRKDDIGRYKDRGVDDHPHDWSMAEIASRIVAAVAAGRTQTASR